MSSLSGLMFTQSGDGFVDSTDWQNFSVIAAIRGCSVFAFPAASGWKARLNFISGTAVIANMVVLRTLSYSNAVIDSTPVTIGGISNPVLGPFGAQTLIDTDPINLAIDDSHDYNLVIFFANDSRNATLTVANTLEFTSSSMLMGMLSFFFAGDQTGVSTIPTPPASPPASNAYSQFLVMGGVFV